MAWPRSRGGSAIMMNAGARPSSSNVSIRAARRSLDCSRPWKRSRLRMSRRRDNRSAVRREPAARREPARAMRPASEARPATEASRGERGALLAILIALAAARALLALVPSMWAWSLNLVRFLDPAWSWGLWVLGAVVLVPPVARRLEPAFSRIGDAILRRPALTTIAAVGLGAALVWAFPDRVRYVGDFLLRQGTVEVAEKPADLFPQALPLDVVLHYLVPRIVSDLALTDANGCARILGMIEAAALAALALAFVRALGLAGAAAVAAAATVFFGGYLGMFTGFSKAFSELCVLVVIVAVAGVRMIREGRGHWPLGLALAVGVTLHRSALGLLPAVAFAWVVWWRLHGGGGAWKRPSVLAALAVPIVGLAVMVPRIVAVVRRWDAVHFAPASVKQQGGVFSAALAGARPADLLNLVVMLSPLALVIPVLLVWHLRRLESDEVREFALLAFLALPFVLVMPFLHPAQGLFRDWDDFAATGVAISLLAAWTLGRALRAMPRRGLAVAATLAVAIPATQWIVHHTDVDRGLARMRAFMLEPPPRPPSERGTTWDFLGIVNFRLERWDESAQSFGHAAETSPSVRILQEWALAETMCKRYGEALRIYHLMLAKAPDNALGWLGLATCAINFQDYPEARRAAHKLLELQPDDPDGLRVLQDADRLEAMRRGAAPAPPASGSPP